VNEGKAIEDAQSRFWRSYQASPDYASMTGLIEEYGPEAILGEAAKDIAG